MTSSYEAIQEYRGQFPERFDKFVDRLRAYLDSQPFYRPIPFKRMFSAENMEVGIKAICLIFLVDDWRLGKKYIEFLEDYSGVKVYPPVHWSN